MFFKIATTWSRVKKGFLSALPFGKNYIHDAVRNLDRRALSTFAPFISGSGRYMGGVPIGVNKITGQLEFINSFGNEDIKPQNYNMGIFGISGSGKSVSMKLKIARELVAANIWARIVDPDGEFKVLTKRLGGINLDISEESNIVINPIAINYTDIPLEDGDEELELLYESDEKEIVEKNGKKYIRFVPIREKINEVLSFFDIIVRGKDGEEDGLTVFERNYLEEALRTIFERLEITSHPSSLFTQGVEERDGMLIQSQVRKPEPTISDVYQYLIDHYGNEMKAERLIAAIRPFLRDGSKPIFDGQTNLGRGVTQALNQSRLVNFNLKQMEEGFLRPIAYHVILNYLWEHFIKNSELATQKKLLYCDEFWQFINQDQTVSFFEKVARRCRKRNAGLVYASQDFVRILNNEKARGVLQNTYSFFFLEQNKIDLQYIRENFNLTEGEIDKLFNNPDKGEGILRVGKSSVWIRTNPSDEEMIFVESNEAVLQEYLKRKQAQRAGGY
jgi:type IV secretory pathway VirB4 component